MATGTAEHVTVRRTVRPGDVITAGEVQIRIGSAKSGNRHIEIEVPAGTKVDIVRVGTGPRILSGIPPATGATP